jgi:hypothetical protein
VREIRPWLLVGRYAETLDLAGLVGAQVGAMLQLADPALQPGIAHLFLPLEDGAPIPPARLRAGVDFARAQRELGRRVLVACGAGISRSTAFCIGSLAEAEGLTLRDAALAVRRAHPGGVPHMALWESLCAHFGEQIGYLEMLHMGEL